MSDTPNLNEQLGVSSIVWRLSDLYPAADSKLLKDDRTWCETEATAIHDEFRGRVKTLEAGKIFGLVKRLEELDVKIGSLATYGFLNFITQVGDSAASALYQMVQELASKCATKTIFFELEWNTIDEGQAKALVEEEILAPYHHYLNSMRRFRPHQLAEGEEKILIETDLVGRSGWNTLFEKVIGHLRFGDKLRTEEELLSELYHPDREVRKQAAGDLTDGLGKNNHILTHIYNTLAADKMISDRLRSYHSWISSMNLSNQVDDATVDTLIEVVTGRYELVQRYYRVKRDLLGLDTLFDYDRYAPVPGLPDKKFSWDECRAIVLKGFGAFSPRMEEAANRFFTESWIHAPVQQGKRGGAFAHPCVPSVHPYIMVNYTGTARDVSTVAHELGHGVHQLLAAEQGYYNGNTPLVLAETASVFAEFLVFQAQLELIDDDRRRRAFICQKLESIFATVFRQVAMNRFEHLMHEGRRERGELSSETLREFWLQTQQEMFGDAVTLRDEYRIWWSYIPHFLHTPGYVYSYAFGELLVLALYNIYQRQGDSFIPAYFDLLAAGGSATPQELLSAFGISLSDANFWQQGMEVIEALVAEVE